MNYYGISKVNWDASRSYIAQVLLHKRTQESGGLDNGTTTLFHNVATLIDRGDQVYVLIPDGPGQYKYGDKVRIKPHQQQEHLESIDEAGNPTSSLYDLVEWTD